MSQRSELRAQRRRISRAIAAYRNFELTIEAAAEQAGMSVEEFRAILDSMMAETQLDTPEQPR